MGRENVRSDKTSKDVFGELFQIAGEERRQNESNIFFFFNSSGATFSTAKLFY